MPDERAGDPRAEGRLVAQYARPTSRTDLVFRTVGERTSSLAFAMALERIGPARVFVIEDVKPFARAVQAMLAIDHHAEQVVHMDADCLILEDLRPFLDQNQLPYVDCFVDDRFRGRIHCGVHVTRADVIARMRTVGVPEHDLALVLRPESRLRNLALAELGLEKQLLSFDILHDHFQAHHDVFAKYALRELRSRTPFQRARLDRAVATWGEGDDLEVARAAIAHARALVPADADADAVARAIRALPEISRLEVARRGDGEQPPLTLEEVSSGLARSSAERSRASSTGGSRMSGGERSKVFGLGLSRTGTRSLTAALHVLGFDTVHYPIDKATLDTLTRGDAKFPLLDHFDGITDITTIPYLAELDELHPGAKFVLTVRDLPGWLKSCSNHWTGRSAFEPATDPEHGVHMEIRRFLRAAVYGCYDFHAERFARVYADHVDRVKRYFASRPNDLLVLDIVAGDGFDKLAPFLGVPLPEQQSFPHKGKKLSERMNQAG